MSDLNCWAPFYSLAKVKYLFHTESFAPWLMPETIYFFGDTSFKFFYSKPEPGIYFELILLALFLEDCSSWQMTFSSIHYENF